MPLEAARKQEEKVNDAINPKPCSYWRRSRMKSLLSRQKSGLNLKDFEDDCAFNSIIKCIFRVNVMDEIMAIPEQGIPPSLLSNAKGIAIIPGVIKAGFIVGGRHGKW
jgi:hypothetical protein